MLDGGIRLSKYAHYRIRKDRLYFARQPGEIIQGGSASTALLQKMFYLVVTFVVAA